MLPSIFLSSLVLAFGAVAAPLSTASPKPTALPNAVSNTTTPASILSNLQLLSASLQNLTAFLGPAGNFTQTNENYSYCKTAAAAPALLATNMTTSAAGLLGSASPITLDPAQQIATAFTTLSSEFSPFVTALNEGVFNFGFAGLQQVFYTNLQSLQTAYDAYANNLALLLPLHATDISTAQQSADTVLNSAVTDFATPFACC